MFLTGDNTGTGPVWSSDCTDGHSTVRGGGRLITVVGFGNEGTGPVNPSDCADGHSTVRGGSRLITAVGFGKEGSALTGCGVGLLEGPCPALDWMGAASGKVLVDEAGMALYWLSLNVWKTRDVVVQRCEGKVGLIYLWVNETAEPDSSVK